MMKYNREEEKVSMKRIRHLQKWTVWLLVSLTLCAAFVVPLAAYAQEAAPPEANAETADPLETTAQEAAPEAEMEAAAPFEANADEAAPLETTAQEVAPEAETEAAAPFEANADEAAPLETTAQEAAPEAETEAAVPSEANAEDSAPQDAKAEDNTPAVKISAPSNEVQRLQSLQLTAAVTGVSGTPRYTWTSSDPSKAIVSGSGKVTGIAIGRTTIRVSADVDGQTLTDAMDIYVIRSSNAVQDLLKNRQILSYQYSYQDDYYYANDKASWQKALGFSKFYDLVAPYAMLETDYVRVKFPYGGKDWMIQLWKGQYGFVFYGSEIGIYTKRHTKREDNTFTMYKCADQSDFLKMEMTLYHDTTGFGTYQRQFTRPYDSYWWCTGFKPGHLRREEPATELRVESRITLKDEEMAKLFSAALEDCGFTRADGEIGLDQYRRDGTDVRLVWQNITHAETTMPVKVVAGANVLAFFLGPLAFMSMLFLDIILLMFVRL